MEIQLESLERPLVKGMINDKVAYFLIDTGASFSLLDIEKSRNFGFTILSKAGKAVGFGNAQSFLYDVGNIKVELNQIPLYYFLVGDISASRESIRNITGIEIDGIIGAPTITESEMIIDLNDNIIIMKDL